jgi:hypothetical protein
MKEVVGEFTARQLGATHFCRSKPINGVWTTGDITVTNACVMPVGFGVGDHQLFVIDFATTTLVGSGTTTVVRPALRRLNTKIYGCADWYNKSLCWNILRHQLLEQMVVAALSGAPKDDLALTLNKLDREGEAYIKYMEKKCRWLKSGRIPFSPEALLWICQCQVYCSFLRWHNGKLRNYGNLCRTAWYCQINALFQLTVNNIKLRMLICKESVTIFGSMGNATGGIIQTIVSKRCKNGRTTLPNKISLQLLNAKRTKPSGAGSTTLSGSTSAAKVCRRCNSKTALGGAGL